jgi:hypothetical protein
MLSFFLVTSRRVSQKHQSKQPSETNQSNNTCFLGEGVQ